MITNAMFCVKNHEFCNIVMGAPIVCEGELQGIFSWELTTTTSCGQRKENDLGVASKLYIFENWFQSSMSKY